ncbi:MAG: hypothetical protein LBS54_09595 [Dysgonamonadaceae bacterium]|jgi:hypothetical protein|nr:hypothetical protein [Dysgonamonadaceae bacterium]
MNLRKKGLDALGHVAKLLNYDDLSNKSFYNMRYYLENSQAYSKDLVSGRKNVFDSPSEFIAVRKTFRYYLGKMELNVGNLQTVLNEAQDYVDSERCAVENSQGFIDDLRTVIDNTTKNITFILQYTDLVQQAAAELDKIDEAVQKHLRGENDETEDEVKDIN